MNGWLWDIAKLMKPCYKGEEAAYCARLERGKDDKYIILISIKF